MAQLRRSTNWEERVTLHPNAIMELLLTSHCSQYSFQDTRRQEDNYPSAIVSSPPQSIRDLWASDCAALISIKGTSDGLGGM